jgi:hypothetical protein
MAVEVDTSNPLTYWRTAVGALLEQTFPDATVLVGEREDTPSKSSDVISIFWPGMVVQADPALARPKLTIRYFAAMPTTSLLSQPEFPDDQPLEQAAWQIAQALQPVRSSLVVDPDTGKTLLVYELAQLTPVRDKNAVEAHLLAWVLNPAGGRA